MAAAGANAQASVGVAKAGAVAAVDPSLGVASDPDTLLRTVLFVVIFLAVWISFHPFPDLAEAPRTVTEGGDRINQIAYSVLFLALAAWAYFHEPRRLLHLVRPVMIVTVLWFGASVVLSWEPALAARRLIFTLMLMGTAAIALLLPKNQRHFSDMMAAMVLAILALCYLGVALAPQLAIHQATDFLEPEHAGAWRGLFHHKNMAGVTMVLFVIVGLFVARARSFGLGALIVVPAAIFLGFTQSKTAIALLPLTLILSAVVTRIERPVPAIALVAVLLGGFNLFTIGSIYFEPIRHLVEELLPDPSFTGRTELWRFAVEHVMQRPIFGYGFYAFWGTEQVLYALDVSQTWVNAASDAHNTYLNLALTIGIPGLLLSRIWIVFLPIVDFYRRPAGTPASPLQLLFLRVLLFGIFSSCFENSFFQQIDSVWFFYITAVFGLRYLSVMPVTA
jgi:O-antigen ligase